MQSFCVSLHSLQNLSLLQTDGMATTKAIFLPDEYQISSQSVKMYTKVMILR